MNKNKLIFIGLGITLLIFILFVISPKPMGNKNTNTNTPLGGVSDPKIAAEKVEIVYFHSSARCVTCVKAGTFVENTMKGFEEKISEGKVVYMDINIEDPTKKEIVDKYQARGSSLFIGTTINGKETTEEEAEAWRYLGSESAFREYLSNRINSLLGE